MSERERAFTVALLKWRSGLTRIRGSFSYGTECIMRCRGNSKTYCLAIS